MEKLDKVLELGFTKIEVCTILGVSTATIHAMINNKRYISGNSVSERLVCKIIEGLDFIYNDYLGKKK